MTFVVLYGGPEPKMRGNINTHRYGAFALQPRVLISSSLQFGGKNAIGQEFEDSYDSFYNSVAKPYSEYLYGVYSTFTAFQMN